MNGGFVHVNKSQIHADGFPIDVILFQIQLDLFRIHVVLEQIQMNRFRIDSNLLRMLLITGLIDVNSKGIERNGVLIWFVGEPGGVAGKKNDISQKAD